MKIHLVVREDVIEMKRIKFPKNRQRKFLKEVLNKIGCPSLRALRERGIDVNYSTMKNYYCEDRLIPENLFNDLCFVSGIKKEKLKFEFLDENWGKVKGGQKAKIS